MVRVFQEVCAVSFNDGVVFDPNNSVKVDRIREETDYGGLSITATAKVDTAEVRVAIYVAFGDSVEPALEKLGLPAGFSGKYLRAYAGEHER
jgi:hypothetical protein